MVRAQEKWKAESVRLTASWRRIPRRSGNDRTIANRVPFGGPPSGGECHCRCCSPRKTRASRRLASLSEASWHALAGLTGTWRSRVSGNHPRWRAQPGWSTGARRLYPAILFGAAYRHDLWSHARQGDCRNDRRPVPPLVNEVIATAPYQSRAVDPETIRALAEHPRSANSAGPRDGAPRRTIRPIRSRNLYHRFPLPGG